MTEKELVTQLIAEIRAARLVLKDAKVNTLAGVLDLIHDLVDLTEKKALVNEVVKANKKELVVQAANMLIDIPMVPEFAEEQLIRIIVDVIVSVLNKRFGKLWGAQ